MILHWFCTRYPGTRYSTPIPVGTTSYLVLVPGRRYRYLGNWYQGTRVPGYHHFRDHVWRKIIRIEHVDTEDQVADMFTKPLPLMTFLRHRKSLQRW